MSQFDSPNSFGSFPKQFGKRRWEWKKRRWIPKSEGEAAYRRGERILWHSSLGLVWIGMLWGYWPPFINFTKEQGTYPFNCTYMSQCQFEANWRGISASDLHYRNALPLMYCFRECEAVLVVGDRNTCIVRRGLEFELWHRQVQIAQCKKYVTIWSIFLQAIRTSNFLLLGEGRWENCIIFYFFSEVSSALFYILQVPAKCNKGL